MLCRNSRCVLLMATVLQIIALVLIWQDTSEAERVSHYGYELAGSMKADGTSYDPEELGVAHRDLPLGTVVSIYNPDTDLEVIAPVNDRGPYVDGRNWDMSLGTARAIGAEEGVNDLIVTVL